MQMAGAVHCALVVQVFTHVNVVVSQRPGAQFATAGTTHIPVPLQVPGGVRVEVVGQLAAAHCEPAGYRAHWPAAHCPVVPHELIGWVAHLPCGSGPLATLVQVPADAVRLHAVQAASQAVEQQTPCAQIADSHSGPAEQAAPKGLRPQLFAIFSPHMNGAMHSALVVQALKHLFALQ